jgi:hypothetical protein
MKATFMSSLLLDRRAAFLTTAIARMLGKRGEIPPLPRNCERTCFTADFAAEQEPASSHWREILWEGAG